MFSFTIIIFIHNPFLALEDVWAVFMASIIFNAKLIEDVKLNEH